MSSKAQDKADADKKLICRNRRATHDYAIESRLEAGAVLLGSEVKSCRAGQANIGDAYVQVMRGEAFLIGARISEYGGANRFNHEPGRTRKLLLHAREIERLEAALQQKGKTAVALSMYFKEGRVKVEIGVGTGKTKVDRREDLKAREADRQIQRAMRRGPR